MHLPIDFAIDCNGHCTSGEFLFGPKSARTPKEGRSRNFLPQIGDRKEWNEFVKHWNK